MAEIVLTGRTGRVLAATSRTILFLVGAVTVASSVALLLWNGFGPGPLDVFIGAIRELTGIPLTFAVWMTFAMLITLAWSLGRRPGPGTLMAPLITGPVMQTVLTGLEQFGSPSNLIVQIPVHSVAIAGVGLGAGALVVSGLGAGTGELLAAAASDRSGRSQPRIRMMIEATWLIIGVALGGPIGFGTVMVALLIGPAVAHGYRVVDSMVDSTRVGLHNTRRRQLAQA